MVVLRLGLDGGLDKHRELVGLIILATLEWKEVGREFLKQIQWEKYSLEIFQSF